MNQRDATSPAPDPIAFLAGGGAMGGLIRSMEWATTPLGPIDSWPQSLRTTVNICLASDLPICVIWGPGLVQLYNDGYRVICGGKHPRSMGQNFPECWKEAWPVIGDAHDLALTGDTAFLETQRIFLERHGFLEECFFTFSFSPIREEAGLVGGLFHPVIEMTTKMLGERRTRALRDLAARTSQAKSVNEALALAAQTLADFDLDLPFVQLYALDPSGHLVLLAGSSGMSSAEVDRSSTVEWEATNHCVWPIDEVLRSGSTVQVGDVRARLGDVQCGPYPESPTTALALPIIPPGAKRPTAVMVAGVSSRLPLNDSYRSFYDLVASAVTTAVANAHAFDEERQRAESLAELDRAKTAFFSNISHEFRTPLTLMLGPVEDLLADRETELTATVADQLEVVNRNGRRLLRLVNSLLDFSRIEAGRAWATFEPTDVAALTRELASVFRSTIERAGLTLTVDCLPLGAPVFVDRDMWEKIVLNLLSNAFKFTFAGDIAVSIRRSGDHAELVVRDTGTGVPAAEMPRLFERFHRVENARGRTHEGSGIGLALVQELLKLHGGTISAESSLGVGTAFTVRVPLGSAHLPDNQIRPDGQSADAGTRATAFVEEALRWLPNDTEISTAGPGVTEAMSAVRTTVESADVDDRPLVLVADDNADMRQYVVRILAEQFRVDAAQDGESALAAVKRQPPDLILTDVMMPRLDGFGLLKELRADPRTRGVPIIMLSARAGEDSRVDGMEAGADDYLVKPFSAKELLARVSAHLQMARLRREASASLREGEERLRMALTAARMVAWRYDASSGKFAASDNADDVFGRTSDSPLDHIEQRFALVHPEDAAQYRDTVARAVADGGSYLSQFRTIRSDNGGVVWLEERGHAVAHVPGESVRLVGVAMDITERKGAEDAIQSSEGRTRTILESIPDGFMAINAEWRFTYINAAGERLLDRMPGDLIGKSIWEEFPAVVGSEFEEIYRRVALQGVGESFTAFYQSLDRWYEVTAYPAPDGLSVYFRDVSAQKKTEERLRASEERRRLALEGAELGMWFVDPSTRAISIDARFQAIFGITERWTSYAQVFDVIHPDDRPTVELAAAAATRLDDPVPYAIEYRILRPDGSLRWVVAKGRTTIDGTGASRRVVSFDGTVADITQRKLDEEERERLVARLGEQDQRKDEFLATLAHELRNPLAPLSNGLQLLNLTPDSSATVVRTRAMMERQLAQMVRLVDDLMDVSRITRGKVELQCAPIDLAHVVQHAVETSRPLIDASRHELTIVAPSNAIMVYGDLTRLAQVLSNLLNNAAKYSEPGGQITLDYARCEDEVRLRVRDTGIGITSQMLPIVFDLFTQSDRSLSKAQGGLGIGLSLVRKLVEMHGGRVEAHSAGSGEGSLFTVWLPAIGQDEDSARTLSHTDSPAVLPAPSSGRRILVADDNIDAAATLSLLLGMMGHEVRTVHDGADAVAAAETFVPHLILLDIGMPLVDGYDACRQIREHAWGQDIPVVALTGWGQADDRQRSADAGFSQHLVKPVDRSALLRVLATFL
ncbi:ATP-binding protein [Gemmatimonas sp.]|uniref:ATP-binding protein n=1 Tax=Gemmatimonas sp. TaxID=1962908 RepID=UPI00286D96E9|nr:ATP-binding protein [Gemmatimonas sp.]